MDDLWREVIKTSENTTVKIHPREVHWPLRQREKLGTDVDNSSM